MFVHNTGVGVYPSPRDVVSVVEALPFGTLAAGPDGGVTHVNRNWTEATGLTLAASLGEGWRSAVAPDDLAALVAAWLKAIATRRTGSHEARLLNGTRQPRWHRIRFIAIRDTAGTIGAWIVTCDDVDDERRGAERLRIAASANAALAQTPGFNGTLATLAALVVPDLADWATINLLDSDGVMRVALAHHRDPACTQACATVQHATMRLVRGANAEVARDGKPRVYPELPMHIVAETMRANGVADNVIDAFAVLGFRSAVFVPLLHHGSTIGVMQMVRSQLDTVPYDDRDVPAFADLAAAAATAIVNAQIFDALLDSERHLAVVSRASDELARSLSLNETYGTFARIVVPELADWASITVRDPGGLRTVAAMHADADLAGFAQSLLGPYRGDSEATGGTAAVIRSGKPEIWTLIDDGFLDRFMNAEGARIVHGLRLRSTVEVPLLVDGETFGALAVGSTSITRLFTADDLPLFEELARRAAAAIGNARRFEQEHRVATALQAAALPKFLPDAFGIVFSGHYAPGRSELQIGGDWYDALQLADGRIVISIGDVLGSGLDAAVQMGNLRQIIRGVAQVYPDPALMLDAADKTLRAERLDRIVTAFVGVLDPVMSTFTYASAGHPPPMMRCSDGTIAELETTGLPLGLRQRDEAATRTVAIPAGALLVFYTDGLTESTRDVIEGDRRLRAALAEPSVYAAADVARALHDAVLFDGSHDDVAILSVRMPPSHDGDAVVRWSFHTDDAERASAARRTLGLLLEARGANERERFSAEVVFGELLANTARYAPGEVDVALDLSGRAPVLHVLDTGPGFRFISQLPDDLLSERGRGIYIVSTLTRAFSVVGRPGGGSHARAVLDAG